MKNWGSIIGGLASLVAVVYLGPQLLAALKGSSPQISIGDVLASGNYDGSHQDVLAGIWNVQHFGADFAGDSRSSIPLLEPTINPDSYAWQFNQDVQTMASIPATIDVVPMGS